MRRVRGSALIVVALLGALPPLLLLDAAARTWAFRGYVALVAVAAARSIVRWTDMAGSSSVTIALPAGNATDDHGRDPFARPSPALAAAGRLVRRLPIGRHRRRAPLTGGAMILQAATSTAGATHHRLRPVARAIADERLRARHGVGVDDPTIARIVGPETWRLLDPQRPDPADRLVRGLPWTDIDAVLTDLEEL